MNAEAEFPAAVLHLGFADPRSPLRLALTPPPPLRVALAALLGARGGHVVESPQGLSSFHTDAVTAVQAAVEALATGTVMLCDEITPTALRAVLVGVSGCDDAARAAAMTRAYRVMSLSRDQTLLLTRDLYQQLDASIKERARLAVSPALADEQADLGDLFDLDWRSASLKLSEVTGVPAQREVASAGERLELTHGGTQLRLTAQDCPFTLGRDKSCGLHLDGDVASRVHGHIEFVHDKFYFVDESRNGTYLLTPQGEEIFLHRERLPLLGRGVISPGAPIVKQSGEVVRYTCRSEDSLSALMGSLPEHVAPQDLQPAVGSA